MPRKEIDYSKTIIYKLCCKNPEIKDIYVGHTTDFRRRKCQHKTNCNNQNSKRYNYNVYKFIRDNGNWDNWEMIMIEEYSCANRFLAEQRERHWLETLNANLNSNIPTNIEIKNDIHEYNRQYYVNNSDKIKNDSIKYYNENIENIKIKRKIYTEKIKDEIKEYAKNYRDENREQLREKSKKYREENMEQLRERKKKYYEENKEKIKEQRSQQIECECGLTYTPNHQSRHKRTNKHLELMKLKET